MILESGLFLAIVIGARSMNENSSKNDMVTVETGVPY